MTHEPRTAEKVLKSLSISDPGAIDLEAIAWLSGAKVKYRELDGCDACIAGRADVAILELRPVRIVAVDPAVAKLVWPTRSVSLRGHK